MKFIGLILICATSCLALILPAIGVVQFPKITSSKIGTSGVKPTQPVGVFDTNDRFFTSQSANQFAGQRDIFPSFASNPVPDNQRFGGFPSPFPNQTQPDPQQPETWNADSQTNVTGSKIGLGMWLLLAPVCLLGLVLWTLSPTPSGSKPRATK